MSKKGIRAVVICAMLTAMAVVLKFFGVNVPIGGATGMKISMYSFAACFAPLLYGPVYGGGVYAITDVLSYILKPDGGYNPCYTLSAMLNGIIIGLIWHVIRFKDIDSVKFKKVFCVVSFLPALFGIINFFVFALCSKSAYTRFILNLGDKSVFLFTYGMIIASVVFAVVFVISLLYKKEADSSGMFLKFLIIFLLANLTETTLNTFFLKLFIPSFSDMAFGILYIPRIIEKTIVTIIMSAVVTYLYSFVKKIKVTGDE